MKQPVEERFWSKVNKDGPVPAHAPELGPCWIWTASMRGDGYGQFHLRGRPRHHHRVAWELVHGDPGALFVLHKCDNRACCNPAHLFLGTFNDNMADMAAKGRSASGERSGMRRHPEMAPFGNRNGTRTHPERIAKGERNGQAILKEADVLRIRQIYAAGGISQTALARQFGVCRTAITHIVNGNRWRYTLGAST